MGKKLPTCNTDGKFFMQMGDRIKEERERLGMNQSEFAAIASATRKTLFNWESGSAAPSAVAVAAWAPHGVDVLYILTGQRQAQTGVTLTPRQAALLDNYEHTSEEGKKIIEGAAFAAAQPAAPVKGRAKRAA